MTENKSRLDRTQKRKKERNKKKKPIWKKMILIFLILFGVGAISVAGLFGYYIATAPKLDEELLDLPFASEFLDKDGNVFGDMGAENRVKIEYEDLPDVLIDALIATEDSRFFEHPGIDIKRIFGAVVGNIKNGFGSEGASTITQQVVENMFLTPEKKIKLKVQEQWLALQLERKYSKEEILEMYLNKVYFGSGAYGVGKAAEVYFGIDDLHDLSLVQAAMLAGLPQRPHGYNPFEYPDLMQGRVNTVLKLMVRHDKISQAEADEALTVDVAGVLTDKKPRLSPYQAFIQQVQTEINTKLDGVDIESDGLVIHTTLDPSAQKHVEFLLTDSAENPIDYPDEKFQAGMTVLDTQSGAIRAIGGQRNNENEWGTNFATGKHQGGSVVKPILAYGPAIEHESWSTAHQLLDEPYTPPGSKEIRNVSRTHKGWVTAREALRDSINVTAAKTLVEIGSERVKDFGEDLGLTFADNVLDPRDAIGGTASEVSTIDIAGAYSAFGNEGIYNEPHTVVKVEFPDGSVIDLKPKAKSVMKDSTAYMITDMMQTVVSQGTGQLANVPGLHIAGKTGTTSGPRDSWFGGFNTNYSIAVWTGYGDNRELSNTQISRLLFKHTMTELSKDIETKDFVKPDSVVEVGIEKGSNPPVLPSSNTPSNNIVKELFVKGTEPTAVSDTFEGLDGVSNLAAQYVEDENAIKVDWDYPDLEDSEITFKVRFKVDEGEFKELTTTSEKEVTLLEVDDDASYTIEVIAIDKENERESDPVSTSIKVEEQEDTEEEEIPTVTNLSVTHNESNNALDVSWNYDGPAAKFEVTINGEHRQEVQSNGVTVNGAEPGTTYEITITPISTENESNKGKSSSTSITIEKEADNEGNQEEENPGNEEEPDDENQDENETNNE